MVTAHTLMLNKLGNSPKPLFLVQPESDDMLDGILLVWIGNHACNSGGRSSILQFFLVSVQVLNKWSIQERNEYAEAAFSFLCRGALN